MTYICGRAPCLYPNCNCSNPIGLDRVEVSPARIGWKCPVCGTGNAPFALKCGHCDDSARRTPPLKQEGEER